MKPLRKITSNKLKVLPLRSPPHMIGGSAQARTADVQRAATLTTENMPSFGQNFEGVDAGRVALEQVRAEPSPRVTHLTYAVRER